MVFAIDPGNIQSAYVWLNDDLSIREFAKKDNEYVLNAFENYVALSDTNSNVKVAIEMIACYGQRVGKEVFETCVYIGQLKQICRQYGVIPKFIYRKEEMEVLCNGQNNGDSGIRRVLIERFAKHDLKNGKGTKKNPDFFYGFAKDIWAAMAVAITYHDKYLGE